MGRRLLCGIGQVDVPCPVSSRECPHGPKRFHPIYSVWRDMIKRCYYPPHQNKHPAYAGCSVDPIWWKLSVFWGWAERQDYKGKFLDKDIIRPGNRLYAPELCAFVTREVNQLVSTKPPNSTPPGVMRRGNRYSSQIRVNGRYQFLGSFPTADEASAAYREAKRQKLIAAAEGQDDPRIFAGLHRHAELLLVEMEAA